MKAQDLRDRARATLAREAGAIVKPHGQRLRVALAFPNTYHIGMSNLGFQTVYRLFNEMEDVVCERVFLPPRQELQDQRAAGLKLLTIESQTPVKEFDVFALSVSFEWDYPNVLTLLRLAGLPIYAAERQAGRDPLVVLGGAVTFVNPEPLALFADVIAAGEGEELVPTLVQRIREATGRESLLQALGQDRGFYVPSAWTPDYAPDGTLRGMIGDPARGGPAPVRKAAVRTTDLLDPPHTQIFTPDTEFGSRFLIEVVRGCANLCRFCWAGYNYLPVRAFDTGRILALAEKARAHANRVGLVSIALCDHPDIEVILERMAGMGYSISPASLRLDDLNESIVRRLVTSGERGVTIAPEAGSDRLRRVINKTFTNEEILDKANLLFANGVENLKLYFMIGLPTETDEDLVAMRDLTAQLRGIMLHHGRTRGRIGRIVASVNPLIPKPGTAFQWMPMEDPAITDKKAKRLKKLVADLDNVYFTVKSERHSFYQALMSLGDRRVAPAIDMVERNGGNWREAVEVTGVNADFYIFRDRSTDAYLPWDVIDGGMKQSFFRSELDKSTRAEWTLPPKRQQENAKLLPVLS
ncbi:radical SAM protein [Luteitalea sp.]|uniref:radical SAM protein n=1 Tax=Luteitalea sp. TaxID=2004800 RepID=UPI0025BF6F19|nr:radical SAM protein [Luteitalea sp.]